MSSKIVGSLAEDNNGNIWFGNASFQGFLGGISRYDGKQIRYYTPREGLYHPIARYIFNDSRNHLWFVHQIGMTRYDGQSFFHYPGESLGNPNGLWSAFEDSMGGLWVTGTTLLRFQFEVSHLQWLYTATTKVPTKTG